MGKNVCPERGDFVWLAFDPQAGHEQKGRRPALVVSKTEFNKRTGFVWVCPVTNTDRKFPFHVAVTGAENVTGYVMVDQLKSLDYRVRNAELIEKADISVIKEVLELADAILF